MTTPDLVTQARARMHALRARLEAACGGHVALHETHISWVLLAGDFAYKLKKPVRLSFLDFSTLEQRRHFCEEELRLNRRLAPSLYLQVLEVRDTPTGPDFGGNGPLLDVALKMRRFPERALLTERLATGALQAGDIDRLAARIAAFHQAAAVAPPDSEFGSPALIAQATQRTAQGIVEWLDRADEPAGACWPALSQWWHDEMARLAPVWAERRRAGRVRECHGDLHLANALVLDDEVTAFDCIEFDPALRWIDVMNDVAFLVMDLVAHGRASFAFRFLDAWLQASGDFAGLATLRFYMVSRALVRAQVSALGQAQGLAARSAPDASDYLRLAARLADAADPRLALMHGLPGSGKSTVAQQLLEQAGAVRVRSDVERKRLFGLGALASSAGQVSAMYGADATARTYARLAEVARASLRAGYPTLVDAAFLRRDERAQFERLAHELGVPMTIIDCQAAPQVLRDRVRRRQAAGGDASEADVAVLEQLERVAEPLETSERPSTITVDTAQPVAAAPLGSEWFARGSAQAGAPKA